MSAAEYSLDIGCAYCGALHEHLHEDGDDLVCAAGHGCNVKPALRLVPKPARGGGRQRPVRATTTPAPVAVVAVATSRATLHDGATRCTCGHAEGEGALVWWTLVRGTLALQCPGCGDLGGAR